MEPINAKELRIGNTICIKNSDGEFNIVDIEPRHILALSDYNDDAFPITLTPEVLETCGFNFNEDSGYYILGKNEAFAIDPKDLGFRYIDSWFFDKTNYLHQLQNLYFALTGTELEYKP